MLSLILLNIYLGAIPSVPNRVAILCKPALNTSFWVHKSTLVNAKEFGRELCNKRMHFLLKRTNIKRIWPWLPFLPFSSNRLQCKALGVLNYGKNHNHHYFGQYWDNDGVTIRCYCTILNFTHQLWKHHAFIELLKKKIFLTVDYLEVCSFVLTWDCRK